MESWYEVHDHHQNNGGSWYIDWVNSERFNTSGGRASFTDPNQGPFSRPPIVPKESVKYGWICPKCESVNAPHVNQCPCSVKANPYVNPTDEGDIKIYTPPTRTDSTTSKDIDPYRVMFHNSHKPSE